MPLYPYSFTFQSGHSIFIHVLVLKEVANFYRKGTYKVHVCFMYVSNVFHRLRHNTRKLPTSTEKEHIKYMFVLCMYQTFFIDLDITHCLIFYKLHTVMLSCMRTIIDIHRRKKERYGTMCTLRKDFVILQLYWWLFSSTQHCS